MSHLKLISKTTREETSYVFQNEHGKKITYVELLNENGRLIDCYMVGEDGIEMYDEDMLYVCQREVDAMGDKTRWWVG